MGFSSLSELHWDAHLCTSFLQFISIYLCTSFLKLLHFIFALHSSNWRNSFLQINFCGSFLKFKFEVSRSLYLNEFVQVCQTIGQGTFKLTRTLRVQFREFINFQILGILYLFFDLFEFNEFACSFLKVICLHVTCLKLPCNSLVTTLCNSLFKSFFALHKYVNQEEKVNCCRIVTRRIWPSKCEQFCISLFAFRDSFQECAQKILSKSNGHQ